MTNQATHVVAGTLLFGRSGATPDGDGHASFSLDGGTLALAAGTTNTLGKVTITADSSLSTGAGAVVVVDDIAVGDGAMLAVSQADAKSVKVNTSLNGSTLRKILLNLNVAVGF